MPNLFIPKESPAGETRVAGTPETVKLFLKSGLTVSIEAGAGTRAFMSDELFTAAGSTIVSRSDGFSGADIVVLVAPPLASDIALMKPGAILIALLAPHRNVELVRALAERKVTSFAMELIPRTTRAQVMDALSSQASIAGYKAVLVAATELPRYFPLMMTAAGTIKPARVVVMGAGVAGLQALATAKRLGAVVEVTDIRPAVKEQVQSLGGRFIDLPMEESGEGTGGYAKEVSADFLKKQRDVLAHHISLADVVITTAQVPGRKAPVLVTSDMLDGMRPGSIVIDLAVEAGGNVEGSKADAVVSRKGVRILGYSNLAGTLPYDASTLYARNVQALSGEFVDKKSGEIKLDMSNEIISGSLLTHDGKVVHAATAELMKGGA